MSTVLEGFVQEAGRDAEVSTEDLRLGEPRPSASHTWRALWDSFFNNPHSQTVKAEQIIAVRAKLANRTIESAVAISAAWGNWRITSIDYYTALTRRIAKPVTVQRLAFGRYRFLTDESVLMTRLNDHHRLRALVGRALKRTYRFERIRVTVQPSLVVEPREHDCMLGIRTTLRERWWTAGLIKDLCLSPFLELASVLEVA